MLPAWRLWGRRRLSVVVTVSLATDPSVKSGYTITLTSGTAVAGTPATCNGIAAGATIQTCFVGGDPISGGGVRYFGTDQGGTIYHSTAAMVVT